jgi:hypothetical protein
MLILFFSAALGLNVNYNVNTFRQIHLKLGDVQIAGKPSSSDEAYSLNVEVMMEKITIIGKTPVAVFWGIQSLLSLGYSGFVPQVDRNATWSFPAMLDTKPSSGTQG